MSDLIFKLRVLAFFMRGAFEQWKAEVWKVDLDATYCCDGRECGCQASTTRDLYGWHLEKRP
ncbi:hypothetical protein [Sphingobium sp. YR768]|uniref:hypothetical protein n=1 Tax=Sphingobium sp. YR768 TaxID=1884365 RepID=UPI0008B36E39|nr:hypothetical protein [Sphingobium sp. YR768]SER94038.1 hypothetical protein SAMN05518866_1261 [Sphingobium sp. YR768]